MITQTFFHENCTNIVNENSLRNLNQPSEVKARAARTKKGMEYYVTRVKKTFIQSPDLLRSLKAAAKRQRVLLEKSVSDDDNGRLSEEEVKELAVINNFLKPYLALQENSQLLTKL